MAHVIIKREIEQEKVVDLPEDCLIEAPHHIGDEETGYAQVA
jgi:hypothetical protein